MMAIGIRPLHPAIGVEVGGIDLSRPLDTETRSALLEAFALHNVLVFPGANISDEQHVTFSRNFSDLETFPQSGMGSR